jgi:hypothetical protein
VIALANPSGCHTVLTRRRRIASTKRPTLLQRIARALSAPAAAMCEHLDKLKGQA